MEELHSQGFRASRSTGRDGVTSTREDSVTEVIRHTCTAKEISYSYRQDRGPMTSVGSSPSIAALLLLATVVAGVSVARVVVGATVVVRVVVATVRVGVCDENGSAKIRFW